MSVARGEVERWRWGGGSDAPAVRSRAIANAMAPASFTGKWLELKPAERRLTGVRALELADPAEEAQAIAIALREALEEPGRTAALVTPDRALARRVSAHLKRWDIEADDSAGRPLSETPPGTLLLALAAAAAEQLRAGRLAGLAQASAGDEGRRARRLARRRPRARPRAARPAPAGRARRDRAPISPIRTAATGRCGSARRAGGPRSCPCSRRSKPPSPPTDRRLPGLLARAARGGVGAERRRRPGPGPPGRAAADLFAELEPAGGSRARSGSTPAEPAALARADDGRGRGAPALRPASAHLHLGPARGAAAACRSDDPRRAQRGHLAALCRRPIPGSRRGIRAELGLPGLERRIGLAAHDFAGALGGRQVLVTRARRDARAPAIASRFWLRLEAMTGGITRAPHHRRWAQRLDRPERPSPRRSARAGAADRATARPDRGDRGRPAQGRSLRLLRAQDARARRARRDRRRSQPGLARQRGPRGARSLDEGGRLRSGPLARRAPKPCSPAPPRIR